MISPGHWHRLVHKDQKANLDFRKNVLERAESDLVFRQGILEICRQDIIFWINTFAWQFNPNHFGHEVGPFITWGFQDEAITSLLACIEDREDVRWQKSREMGASWLVLMVILWLAVFHDRKKCLVLSRDADAVDRFDDPDCLFWKLDFLNEHMPRWMTGVIKRKKFNFKFERTQSTINGEANTIAAGVGGRAAIMLVDEFGQFANGYETYSLTSDTSYCRVFVFTHKDKTSMTYDLCFDPKYSAMREIITHWSQHPEKNRGLYRYNDVRNAIEVLDKNYDFPANFRFVMEAKPVGGPFPSVRSPWYDKECIRRTDRDVCMNLDIDPRGSSDIFFDAYRLSVLRARHCCEPYWTGKLDYNKENGRPDRLIADPKGQIKLWMHPKSEYLLPSFRAGAGVDVSAGTGMTPSCLSIMHALTGEKVLEYANANIYAPDFAVFCVAICRMFADEDGTHPILSWEMQGSAAFAKRVRELGYNPIFINRDEEAVGNPFNSSMRAGVNQSPRAILEVMEHYRDGLYTERCINRSDYALAECLNFVYTTSGVEYKGKRKPSKMADEGSGARMHHGDVVKADALAFKMIKEMGFDKLKKEVVDPDYIDPTTMAGRMKLWERDREAEEVWV